jgi:hypothetical protein
LSKTNKNSGGGAGRLWPLFVGLPLILAVAVAAVLLSGGERPQSAGQERPPQPAEEERSSAGSEEASRGDAELGHPSVGSADAPVVMIEYGDFQ